MYILLIGVGFMGNIIKSNLRKYYPNYKIIQIDPNIDDEDVHDSIQSSLVNIKIEDVFCAFVTTPVEYHFDTIRKLALYGVKNIYCEKPLVTSVKQNKGILLLQQKYRLKIAVGYILRNKRITEKIKSLERNSIEEGYFLDHIDIRYQKHKEMSKRRIKDLGIFEELFHVIDWINYMSQNYAINIIINGSNLIEDFEFPQKYIQAHILGTIVGQNHNTTFNIISSFKEIKKIRQFKLYYVNELRNIKVIDVTYDNESGYDEVKVITFDKKSKKLLCKFNSSNKVKEYIDDVFKWFSSDYLERNIFTSTQNINLIDIAKQIIQCNNGQKRIIDTDLRYQNIDFKTALKLSEGRIINDVIERKVYLDLEVDHKVYKGNGNSIDSVLWANPSGIPSFDNEYLSKVTEQVGHDCKGMKCNDIFNTEMCIYILSKNFTNKFSVDNKYKIPSNLMNLIVSPFSVAILHAAEQYYDHNILDLYFKGKMSRKVLGEIKRLHPMQTIDILGTFPDKKAVNELPYIVTISSEENYIQSKDFISKTKCNSFKIKVDSGNFNYSLSIIQSIKKDFPKSKYYLDANQSFLKYAEFCRYIRELLKIIELPDIIGFEEPFKDPFSIKDDSIANSEIKFFLDESLNEILKSYELISRGYNVTIKIVKPIYIIYYQILLASALSRSIIVQDLSLIGNSLRVNLGLANVIGDSYPTEANNKMFLKYNPTKSDYVLKINDGRIDTLALNNKIF